MKYIWNIGGIICVGFALLGIPLPLLPTVPFLLLAAFCFARGSDRLHKWLVTHPRLGPPIQDWNDRGVIGATSKKLATISVCFVFTLSLWLGLAAHILIIQAITLGCVMLFVWTRPSE